jgi:hypothetical protein
MKKVTISLTLTIAVLFSTHLATAQKKLEKILEKITPVPQSTKTLDIPKYDNGYPFIYWHYCKQKQAQLGLSSPEISNDSLILRVWLTAPFTKKNQRQDLTEIRYVDGRWVARVTNMRVDLSGKTEEKITNFTITEVSPVATWSHLIDSLYYYHVDSLPTDERLPNYGRLTSSYANNAPTFCFEYATPRTYRFYQYNNPWKLAEYYDEAVDAANLLHMLNRELRIDSLSIEFKKKFER